MIISIITNDDYYSDLLNVRKLFEMLISIFRSSFRLFVLQKTRDMTEGYDFIKQKKLKQQPVKKTKKKNMPPNY